jgi:lysophospholipase L1-like esterase
MKGWEWLTEGRYTWGSAARIVAKGLLLFALVNVIWAIVGATPAVASLSIYGLLVPYRDRLPYGENAAAYNLSTNSLEAMFGTHALRRPKAADEYRVLVLGDSATWGILLRPEETTSGQLNALGLRTADGRRMVFYNVAHPIMSLTKDLALLEMALAYSPDMILWPITLESLHLPSQLEPPLLQHNASRVRQLIARYSLPLDAADSRLKEPDFLGRTLIGERRLLADWLRLQLYGVAWATTGVDQVYGDYTPRSNDFAPDQSWHELPAEAPLDGLLAVDMLRAGHTMAGAVPVLLVNEPIFVADGENSEIRYNFWYPKWAYDAYRTLLAEQAQAAGWRYADLWDIVPPAEFTDSPVHLTPEGSALLASRLGPILQTTADSALVETDE